MLTREYSLKFVGKFPTAEITHICPLGVIPAVGWVSGYVPRYYTRNVYPKSVSMDPIVAAKLSAAGNCTFQSANSRPA